MKSYQVDEESRLITMDYVTDTAIRKAVSMAHQNRGENVTIVCAEHGPRTFHVYRAAKPRAPYRLREVGPAPRPWYRGAVEAYRDTAEEAVDFLRYVAGTPRNTRPYASTEATDDA